MALWAWWRTDPLPAEPRQTSSGPHLGRSTETGRRPAQGLYTWTTGSLETSVTLLSVWW